MYRNLRVKMDVIILMRSVFVVLFTRVSLNLITPVFAVLLVHLREIFVQIIGRCECENAKVVSWGAYVIIKYKIKYLDSILCRRYGSLCCRISEIGKVHVVCVFKNIRRCMYRSTEQCLIFRDNLLREIDFKLLFVPSLN